MTKQAYSIVLLFCRFCQVKSLLMSTRDFRKEAEFLQKLKANEISTPNEFTIQMGKLIKKAREEAGWSQSQLASEISRRRATISNIENGKSEIGVLTLVVFAVVLKKPISYFFQNNIIKEIISDVKTPLEDELLIKFRELEYIGDSDLALSIIKLLVEHFSRATDEQYPV